MGKNKFGKIIVDNFNVGDYSKIAKCPVDTVIDDNGNNILHIMAGQLDETGFRELHGKSGYTFHIAINSVNNAGMTPCHIAIDALDRNNSDDHDFIAMLENMGCDLSIPDANGMVVEANYEEIENKQFFEKLDAEIADGIKRLADNTKRMITEVNNNPAFSKSLAMSLTLEHSNKNKNNNGPKFARDGPKFARDDPKFTMRDANDNCESEDCTTEVAGVVFASRERDIADDSEIDENNRLTFHRANDITSADNSEITMISIMDGTRRIVKQVGGYNDAYTITETENAYSSEMYGGADIDSVERLLRETSDTIRRMPESKENMNRNIPSDHIDRDDNQLAFDNSSEFDVSSVPDDSENLSLSSSATGSSDRGSQNNQNHRIKTLNRMLGIYNNSVETGRNIPKRMINPKYRVSFNSSDVSSSELAMDNERVRNEEIDNIRRELLTTIQNHMEVDEKEGRFLRQVINRTLQDSDESLRGFKNDEARTNAMAKIINDKKKLKAYLQKLDLDAIRDAMNEKRAENEKRRQEKEKSKKNRNDKDKGKKTNKDGTSEKQSRVSRNLTKKKFKGGVSSHGRYLLSDEFIP